MKQLLLHGLLYVLASQAAWAQTLSVVATSPADGSTGVPLQTTVSITFSESVAGLAVDLEEIVFAEPDGAIDYGGYSLSADGRTATFAVTHEPDTDYTWFVAEHEVLLPGTTLAPTSFFYTTAATKGAGRVAGTLSFAGPPPALGALGAVVYLADRDPFAELVNEEPQARYLGLAGTDGTYLIENVRPGTYWPVALRYLPADPSDPTSGFLEAGGIYVGFFDADEDGTPDPITVADADVGGVDIELVDLHTFAATARPPADEARATAEAETGYTDLVLTSVLGAPVLDDGRSLFWEYEYHSASAGEYVIVIPAPGNFGPTEVETYVDEPPAFTIPDAFFDSDAALETVEGNGGSDVRAQFETVLVSATAGRMALFDLTEELPTTERAVWVFAYFGFPASTDPADFVQPSITFFFVDMADGAFLGSASSTFTLDDIWQQTQDFLDDLGASAVLFEISADRISARGEAGIWTFRFYVGQPVPQVIELTLAPPNPPAPTFDFNPAVTDPTPLPSTFADTDAVLEAALAVGGREFLNRYPDAQISLAAGYFPDAYPDFAETALFVVTFQTPPSGEQEARFTVALEMDDAEVVAAEGDGFSVAVEAGRGLPGRAVLHANYPNPFNPATTIPFVLAEPGWVRLAVHDLLGREVAILVEGLRPAGLQEATWEAVGFPSGVYVYRLEAEGTVRSRRLTLMK